MHSVITSRMIWRSCEPERNINTGISLDSCLAESRKQCKVHLWVLETLDEVGTLGCLASDDKEATRQKWFLCAGIIKGKDPLVEDARPSVLTTLSSSCFPSPFPLSSRDKNSALSSNVWASILLNTTVPATLSGKARLTSRHTGVVASCHPRPPFFATDIRSHVTLRSPKSKVTDPSPSRGRAGTARTPRPNSSPM